MFTPLYTRKAKSGAVLNGYFIFNSDINKCKDGIMPIH